MCTMDRTTSRNFLSRSGNAPARYSDWVRRPLLRKMIGFDQRYSGLSVYSGNEIAFDLRDHGVGIGQTRALRNIFIPRIGHGHDLHRRNNRVGFRSIE